MDQAVIKEKLNGSFEGNWTDMAGTDVSREYVVLAGSVLGRVGVRDIRIKPEEAEKCPECPWMGLCMKKHVKFRVRVEPMTGSDEAVAILAPHFEEGIWKQPGHDHQDRFSTVTPSDTDLGKEVLENGRAITEQQAVAIALKALAEGGQKLVMNEAAPEWARELMTASA